ncbi:MAG: ABC transporter ATP-binding protein [Rhodothermia bacterium]|nr:ABC transporter ATP-binding protein [Rhodothermia bacterium]
MNLIDVEQLTRHYQTQGGVLEVLKGVSFSVSQGEVVAVVGQSGAGKSTLLHILGTLDRPTSGQVRFNGEDVFAQKEEELARFRNKRIGFVFQFHHLLPEFTALENVAMPALIRNKSMVQVEARAKELMALLGLKYRSTHRPGQLSGGEQQRVAMARALMNEPDLILADEPTGNLDIRTAATLHEEIVRLSREMNQTFIIVTHNPALAQMADRVLRMEDGFIFEQLRGSENGQIA